MKKNLLVIAIFIFFTGCSFIVPKKTNDNNLTSEIISENRVNDLKVLENKNNQNIEKNKPLTWNDLFDTNDWSPVNDNKFKNNILNTRQSDKNEKK